MRRSMEQLGLKRWLTLTVAFLALQKEPTCAQTLVWIDPIPNTYISYPQSVSADGTTVVGYCFRPEWKRAFRWVGRTEDLGSLRFPDSYAYDVSADGTVVVGEAEYSNDTFHAFRWDASSARMYDLGDFGGGQSAAYGVSANGTVIVGYAFDSLGRDRAFRWTEVTGLVDIGTLGGCCASAHDVSTDGSIIVGASTTPTGDVHACLWRWNDRTIIDLGVLPGYIRSEAYGVSANGDIVVGILETVGSVQHAFVWRERSGMIDLGTLGGRYSRAYSVASDGTVVGGSETASYEGHAFRWTPTNGMEDLNTLYASVLPPGSYLEEARAISPDGRYIVGVGYNAATRRQAGFLLDTYCTAHNGDVDNNGCIDDADLLAVLFAFGNTGSHLGRVDTNCDQVVDDADLLTVLFNFGNGC
jgi:probable HAF family extracellular repeat protein